MAQYSRDGGYYELYVGSIAVTVSEEELRSLFEECGNITRLFLSAVDPIRPYRYGFIRFADDAGCTRALNTLRGKELHGMCLVIELSKNHPTNLKLLKENEPPHDTIQQAVRNEQEAGVRDRLKYVRRCYDDAPLNFSNCDFPGWSVFRSSIQHQPCTSSAPFTYPMKPMQLDLSRVEDLVNKMRMG